MSFLLGFITFLNTVFNNRFIVLTDQVFLMGWSSDMDMTINVNIERGQKMIRSNQGSCSQNKFFLFCCFSLYRVCYNNDSSGFDHVVSPFKKTKTKWLFETKKRFEIMGWYLDWYCYCHFYAITDQLLSIHLLKGWFIKNHSNIDHKCAWRTRLETRTKEFNMYASLKSSKKLYRRSESENMSRWFVEFFKFNYHLQHGPAWTCFR